jgi:hypothetical protein
LRRLLVEKSGMLLHAVWSSWHQVVAERKGALMHLIGSERIDTLAKCFREWSTIALEQAGSTVTQKQIGTFFMSCRRVLLLLLTLRLLMLTHE